MLVVLINAKLTGVKVSNQNSIAIAGVMLAFPALISKMHHITQCLNNCVAIANVAIMHTAFEIFFL